MENTQKIVVCPSENTYTEVAKALAERLNIPLSEAPGEQLTLLVGEEGLSLTGYGLSYRGDFEQMLNRITKGRLPHEMLVHVAKTKEEHPTAIDATAGMGEDSILLAAAGYDVTLFEQNPVIAALLQDALDRAKDHPILGEIVARMHLIHGDSISYMEELAREQEQNIEQNPTITYVPEVSEQPESEEKKRFDVIYLDPMFPARQKSGLINKKLQLIQKLEQPCFEEEKLLEAALALTPKKLIIKRPLKGANLAGKTPNYTIKGKAIRYDCFRFAD